MCPNCGSSYFYSLVPWYCLKMYFRHKRVIFSYNYISWKKNLTYQSTHLDVNTYCSNMHLFCYCFFFCLGRTNIMVHHILTRMYFEYKEQMLQSFLNINSKIYFLGITHEKRLMRSRSHDKCYVYELTYKNTRTQVPYKENCLPKHQTILTTNLQWIRRRVTFKI